jgi:hypothetical protein
MPPEAEGPDCILPIGDIDLFHVEHDAREVAREARSRRRVCTGRGSQLHSRVWTRIHPAESACADVFQQASAIESFNRRKVETAHSHPSSLQGRTKVCHSLQYKYRNAGQSQFAGQKWTYGSTACNHNVVNHSDSPGSATLSMLYLCGSSLPDVTER